MVETLTVRLFVHPQTYDIPCDPQQPGSWLLHQAQVLQQRNSSKAEKEAFHVLFNRTRRQQIDLQLPLGRSVTAMDVVEAQAHGQQQAVNYQSTTLPWLRGRGAIVPISEEAMQSSDGLFFQQLCAYAMLGKRVASVNKGHKEQEQEEAFLKLLHLYSSGECEPSSDQGPIERVEVNPRGGRDIAPTAAPLNARVAVSDTTQSPASRSGHRVGSDVQREESIPPLKLNTSRERNPSQSKPSLSAPVSPVSSPVAAKQTMKSFAKPSNKLNDMESVFDIEFKEQAIGMRLGSDDTKRYAVVKECFEGSEAKRYPEIQSGVVILAVNGQEVLGLALSRILYRLREAPRPVVVRFGRLGEPSRKAPWG